MAADGTLTRSTVSRVPAAERHLHAVAPVKSEPPVAPSALDDSLLLSGLRERDPAMAAAFYDRVRPIVDRTLLRLLGARDPDYEDVAQLALFELVDTIDRFRGECPLDAWISIVAARVVYHHIRRRKLERRIFSSAPLEELMAADRRGDSAVTREAVARVRQHLEKVDERRVWTFLLHDVYGYDLKEIGEIMGVSLAAAQSRLVRGRREIHERVRKDRELAHFLDGLSDAEVAP